MGAADLGRGKAKSALPFIFGIGLNFAWVSSVFFQDSIFRVAGGNGVFNLFYVASMAILIGSLVAFGIYASSGNPRKEILNSDALAIAMASIVAIGTLCALSSGFFPEASASINAIGIVLTGLGSAYILVLWSGFLAKHPAMAAVALCAAYAIGAAAHFVLSLFPVGLFAFLVTLLPLASVAIALKTRATRYELEPLSPASDSEDASTHQRQSMHDLLVKACSASTLFGVSLGLIQGILSATAPELGRIDYAIAYFIAIEVVLVTMLVYSGWSKSALSSEERFALVYRAAALLMIGSLLVAIVTGSPHYLLAIISLVGYTCFKIVLWNMMAQGCQVSKYAPATLFAFGEASITIGLFAGTFGMRIANSFIVLDEFMIRTIIAVCIALVLIGYLFVFTERQMLTVNALVTEGTETHTHRRFHEKCENIAKEYRLSKRETNVFMLFVRGRSSARIAEDLYISKGTVTTHLRNIYRKIDVHSRQELLDILDGTKNVTRQEGRQERESANTAMVNT